MITLALSTDERGFAYNATLIASILRRTARAVWERCWCRGFLPESFETGRLRVEFLPAVEAVTGRYPGSSGPAAYDRLLVIRDCPDWDRCMVMDYDQLVLCDMGPLFELDMGDHLLAAHMQGPGVDMAYAMRVWLKRPMPEGWEHVAGHPYFLMPPLMNLKAMREAGTWKHFLKAHAAFGADEQLSLTAATEGRSLPIEAKWNLFPKLHIRDGEVPEGIIHWSGWPKPWHKDAKVWRPDIWEAERATWEHLRMGIWEKPLAIEVEPDDLREVRALLERGWKVVVGVGRQTQDCKIQDARADLAFPMVGSGAATLSRARLHGEAEGETQDCRNQDARADLAFPRAGSGSRQAGAGARRSSNGLEQNAPATLRPPLEAEDLGLVGFPDLVVREGGAEGFADLLASVGREPDMMRFGMWSDPGVWLEGVENPPRHLAVCGALEPVEIGNAKRRGYGEGAVIKPGEWPAGGPLPRVLEFSALDDGAEVPPGSRLYLRHGGKTWSGCDAAWPWRREGGMEVTAAEKVAVAVVATGGRVELLRSWIRSVRRNFLPEHERRLVVFSDVRPDDGGDDLVIVPVAEGAEGHMGMGCHALLREHWERFDGMDHVFLLDAVALITGRVGREVIGEGLAGVLHAGFHEKPASEMSYERREISTACVGQWEGGRYYTGVFQGGEAGAFREALCMMAETEGADARREVSAVWGAESHWNRLLASRPPAVELPPSHGRPDWQATEFPQIVAIRMVETKTKVGGQGRI